MNFNYVVQRREKAKVCFGSGLERKLLGADIKGMVSRHGRHYTKENLSTAPGMYEISVPTSAFSMIANKPTSNLGTVLGGRKAERKFYTVSQTPPPGTYDLPMTFPEEFLQSCAPFNSTTERTMKIQDIPGVGTYTGGIYKRRRAAFKHSFGGKTCLQPSVKVKCGPFNFDECERCQIFPEGDYWYLDLAVGLRRTKKKKVKQAHPPEGTFLCRDCYEIEKKQNKIFTKLQMQHFKKIRDCSKIHFHDGCKGKLFLVPPQEIAKLKQREGYLSLFFD